MPPTLSPSAKATPKMDAGLASSGIPPTDPLYVDTLRDTLAIRHQFPVSKRDPKYLLWTTLAHLKHLIGWHTYVRLDEWDPEDETLRYLGVVCWICPRTL